MVPQQSSERKTPSRLHGRAPLAYPRHRGRAAVIDATAGCSVNGCTNAGRHGLVGDTGNPPRTEVCMTRSWDSLIATCANRLASRKPGCNFNCRRRRLSAVASPEAAREHSSRGHTFFLQFPLRNIAKHFSLFEKKRSCREKKTGGRTTCEFLSTRSCFSFSTKLIKVPSEELVLL